MQLDDARRSSQRDFILVSNDGVLALGNRGARPFQERIPIRGKHVAPWKTKESPMHRVGFMVVVPNQSPEEVVQIGASERGFVFLREPERIPRGRHVPRAGDESSASSGGYNLSDIPFVTSNHVGGSDAPGRAFRAHLLKPAPIMTDAPPPVCCHRAFRTRSMWLWSGKVMGRGAPLASYSTGLGQGVLRCVDRISGKT